jgi:anti-sigma28 factor (negative regulator of flagellin synthesis)
MKINPVNNPNIINRYEKIQRTPNENKTSPINRDKVDISKDYDIYEKSLRKLKETKDIENLEKLDMLKEKIAKGEYKVSSRDLARAIIQKLKESGE